MVKIKFCGLSRLCDIEAANKIKPEYIGFVFARKSKRYVTPNESETLKKSLVKDIKAVGVFVNEEPENVAGLLSRGIIDIAQLHGGEDEAYIARLRKLTDKPIIKAFRIDSKYDVISANNCSADFVLLDSGSGGTGKTFDWNIIKNMEKPYFLAGGLNLNNIDTALEFLSPYAFDISSGIETNGQKDAKKMQEFACKVRSSNTR